MLKLIVRVLALSAILVGTFFVTPARPALAIGSTLYVATTGNNTSNNCLTAPTPCQTIAYAITQAVDGDQILVAAGTYNEHAITVNLNISIIGASMQTTIVDGGGTDRVFIIPSGKTVELEKMKIQNGVTSGDGGGIHNDGDLTLLQVRVADNNGSAGAGVWSSGPLKLTDVMVNDNIASLSGGGLFLTQAGSDVFNRVAIYHNQSLGSTSYSGGIHHQGGGILDLVNASIYNNTGHTGGGITNTGGSTVHVLNSTISGNHAVAAGGFANFSTVDFKNTILSANDVADCANSGGSLTDNGYNLLSDSSCGAEFTDVHDLLSTPVSMNFNSPSWIGYVSVLAPISGSPTIDAGTDAGCPSDDARMAARPVDGDLVGGATCDIGAYEYRPASAITVTSDLPDPSGVGVPFSVHVTVTGSAATPTGLVYIAVSESYCIATLSAGSGSCTLTPGISGSREIDVYHEGDAQYEGSSNFATHIVTQTSSLYSAGAADGWILESSENSNVGGTLNNAATTFNLGDDAANRQYRAILHFNTAGLPDTAVITKATLKIRKQGLVGTDPFSTHGLLRVDLGAPYFGTTAGLQIGDFQVAPSGAVVAVFGAPVGNLYSAMLSSTGRLLVNRTGTTQFRLRFPLDDNNDLGADYMRFYSGNFATVANRPTLVIDYYVP